MRRAQRGTWFSLVLLGLVVFAAMPVYRFGSHGQITCGPVTPTPGGGLSKRCLVSYGWPAFIYWTVALVGAYVVIAGFYVLQARRRGVGTRIQPYITAGIAALLLVAALWPVQQDLGGSSSSGSGLALVVHGLNPLLAIGLALFMLAWAERHGALLAFAAAYLAAALLASFLGIPRRLLEEHGWAASPQTIFLPGLWLAGTVLLAGGAAFAITDRRLRP